MSLESETETKNNFDKFVSDEEKKEILNLELQLEGKCICQYLKKENKFYYYCQNLASIPKHSRKVDLKTLKTHCMKNYEECEIYLDMLDVLKKK